MGLEALQLNNLVRIAEEAKDRYVNLNLPLPGKASCGEVQEFIAEKLYAQLGNKLFERTVSSAFFKTKDGRKHFLIVVGGKKPDFRQTFKFGTKLDPTICQFRDIHPELDQLNGRVVFNGDYPKIYLPDSLRENPYFPTIIDAIKMRIKRYNI